MLKQILICGYPGSGTRVVSHILKNEGYNIGSDLNDCLDYMPHLNDDFSIEEKEPWALKHGQTMLRLDKYKKQFPDAKVILVYRNGIDNILNGFKWHKTYCKKYVKSENELFAKMEAYIGAHEDAIPDIDYFVSLERMIVDKLEVINNLFNFVGIKGNPAKYDTYVQKPNSMGRRYVDINPNLLYTLMEMHDPLEHRLRELTEGGI